MNLCIEKVFKSHQVCYRIYGRGNLDLKNEDLVISG